MGGHRDGSVHKKHLFAVVFIALCVLFPFVITSQYLVRVLMEVFSSRQWETHGTSSEVTANNFVGFRNLLFGGRAYTSITSIPGTVKSRPWFESFWEWVCRSTGGNHRMAVLQISGAFSSFHRHDRMRHHLPADA
jgi:hypothetical protein